MDNESVLTCTINIEWTNAQAIAIRKWTHKTATVRLIRSDTRDIYLEVTAPKTSTTKLPLKGINVHKRFMSEGKASIKFQEEKCTLFLSNAPPNHLFAFLRTLFIKMTGEKAPNAKTSLRTQLLAHRPKQFQEISPLTMSEVENVKSKLTKGSETTPSPSAKRKLSPQDREKCPASKRLYTSSPVPVQPLDIEQKEVMDACLSSANVFFTGSAGTGKSYLLKRIIGALPPEGTFATASTGVAACHIGGITLHNFAGIGTGDATIGRCIELASRPAAAQQWRRCKRLIIDEISMVDGNYFGKIEQVAREIRKNDKPFGGIQLILCGDFFQLPPVCRNRADLKFCFQSSAWNECQLACFELKRVHRQTDDEFITILNKIRRGQIPEHMAQRLAKTSKQTIEKNGILATRLCSHTQDSNLINESKLAELKTEKSVFMAEDSNANLVKTLDQQTPVAFKLELKIGAQVMLLKNVNLSTGLVNGARGVVKAFKDGLPLVQFRNKEYLARHERWSVKAPSGAVITRRQVPLKLAWAFSIHKSQGLTLDCVEMSLGKVFEAGQAYVALSRAQSLDTLRVMDFKASQVWANDKVLEFYRTLHIRMEGMRLIPLGVRKENVNKKSGGRVKKSGICLSKKPLVSIS